MPLKPLQSLRTSSSPTAICCSKPRAHQNFEPNRHTKLRRGILVASIIASTIVIKTSIDGKRAIGLDFGLVAPDQTMEEAESLVREHASSLLEIKAQIDFQSWKEARILARKRAAFLRRDFNTIIEGSPRSERPKLRKLYFDLFNNVSKLDFAARDEDASRVLQCYDNIVTALTDILSII